MKRKLDLMFILLAIGMGGIIGFKYTGAFAKNETSAIKVSEQRLPILFDPVGKFHLQVDISKNSVYFSGEQLGPNPTVTVDIIPAAVKNYVEKEVKIVEVPVKYYMLLPQIPAKSMVVISNSKPDTFER